MNERKVYVSVNADFDEDGRLTPLSLVWEDGTRFEIDRVLAMAPAPARKAGGQGDRYTIRVRGHQSYLFFEHAAGEDDPALGRWFVERR